MSNPSLTAAAAVICLCTLGCTTVVVTQRYSVIDCNSNTITLNASGFHLAPLTPEGMFPNWSHQTTLFLRGKHVCEQTGTVTYVVGRDVTSAHDQVKSGTVMIHLSENRLILSAGEI